MQKEQIAALVRKAQAGDEQAMSDLLALAHGSVIFQCRKIMAHPEDAEDMAQEVLIKIYEKLDTLQTPETFLSWANTIAARLCLNERQRNPKDLQFMEDEEGHSVLDNLEDMDQQNVPDAAIDNEETRRMIVALVDDLPEAQRTTIYLYYYDELSVKEIADIVGVSENTIKSRLNYARKAIKEGVLDYEKKQGIKLYGISPMPFLLYFLRGAAESSTNPAAAAAVAKTVLAAEGAAGAAAVSAEGIVAGSAGSTAVTSSTAAGANATGAAAVAGDAAAKGAAGIFSGAATKITAGVLAGTLAVGGVGLLLSTPKEEPAPIETPYVEEVVGIAAYTMERTTVDTQGYPVEIYIEAPRFEEISEGYRKLNERIDSVREKFLNGEDHNVAYLLAHLDKASAEEPLYYIEIYEVESQDDSTVTLNITHQQDLGGGAGHGSGSRTFDALTGEQTFPKVTEERIAGMQEWLEETRAEYESGGYEYGENCTVYYRPEFWSYGAGFGSPKTPQTSQAPVSTQTPAPEAEAESTTVPTSVPDAETEAASGSASTPDTDESADAEAEAEAAPVVSPSTNTFYYDTYVDSYGFTWVEVQDGGWTLYINGKSCGGFEESLQAGMAGIKTYEQYIYAFGNRTYYTEHDPSEQTAEDIAPRPMESY